MVQTIQVVRFLVQAIVFVLINARIFGVAPISVPVPFLQPSGSPFTVVRGAYDDFEGGLSHSEFPFLALGVTLLTAITVGKLLCAWACPFGLVQDVVAALFNKKPRALSEKKARQLRDIKWGVLGFTLLWCFVNGSRRATAARYAEEEGFENDYPRWTLRDAPFSTLSPAATLFAYVPWLAMWNPSAIIGAGIIAWIKLGLLAGFLVAAATVPRFFCRFVCPMGAVFEPFTKFKALKIRRDKNLTASGFNSIMEKCCPMGVSQTDANEDSPIVAHPNCIHCGRCTAASPLLMQELF